MLMSTAIHAPRKERPRTTTAMGQVSTSRTGAKFIVKPSAAS